MSKLMILLRGCVYSRLYWGGLVLLGLAFQAAALFYQYVLDEWPCILCIHIRIWISGFIIVSLVALFLVQSKAAMRVLHGLLLVMMIGFLERSYQILAVERGWVFGDCDMELGMPAWFALDKWLPVVFEVQTSCGYTPLILFQISMAEVLLVVSALLALISATVFALSWIEQ